MSLVFVNLEDLAAVVKLACLTEDRTGPEQRALLNLARKVDRAWNTTMNRKTWERVDHGPHRPAVRLLRPLSSLEALVESTRELGEHDRPVKLPDKGRWKLNPELVVVE